MSDLEPHLEENAAKKPLMNLYAALGVSILLSLIPNTAAAVISLLFFLGVFIAAYQIRKKSEDHGLKENHCTYIIRTFWIAGLYAAISTAIAAYYMLQDISYTAFESCGQALASKSPEDLQSSGFNEIWLATEPCYENFIADNFTILMNSGLIAAVPPLLYMIYRYIKGFSRAIKGYRLSNPKGWF